MQTGNGVNLDVKIVASSPAMAEAISTDVTDNLADTSAMTNLIQQAVPDIAVEVTSVAPVATETTVLSGEDLALLPSDFVAGLKGSPPANKQDNTAKVGLREATKRS